MTDIDDIFDDEEDRASYATREVGKPEPAPTAATPTPEELAEACIADMDGCTYRGRVDAIAAAIRQHSEALRAENERLTEQNTDLEKAALTAYENGVEHAFEAAKEEAYQRGYDARQAEIVRALEEAGGRIVLEHGPASVGMVTLINERAEKAEAASAASLERERGMRGALTGLADVMESDCGVEPCVGSMAPAEHYLGLARAALAAKETTDGR